MRPVLWLHDGRAADPALTGRKAAGLARLHAAGFDVPDGFVLTTVATTAVIGDRMPEATWKALGTALRRLGDVPLVVRSSRVADDLPETSCDGRHKAILDIRGRSAAEQAILHCLASASSDAVEADLVAMGDGPIDSSARGRDPGFAILLQRLVPADISGVAFTADPMTGDRDVVRVAAVRGLGARDQRIDGAGDTEEWIVRDDRPIDGRTSPPAPWPVARPPEAEHPGPRRVRIGREPVLEPETARRIAALVRRVEVIEGAPQDVEWALEGERLWLLQARPIDGLPVPPDGSRLAGHAWWRDDEHAVIPASALGAAVSVAGENRGFEHMFRLFGVLREKSCYLSVGGLMFGRRSLPLGLPPVAEGPAYAEALAVSAPVRRRLPIADKALREGLAQRLVARWHDEWGIGLERDARGLLAVDLPGLDDRALTEHFEAAIDLAMRGLDIHFVTWMPYYLALHALDAACHELLGWEPGASLQLLAGVSDPSFEATRALAEVAGLIASSPAGRAALEASDAGLGRVGDVEPRLRVAIDGYLERFGARPLSGDPGEPTLAERPDVLFGLLRGLVARAGQAAVAGTSPSSVLEARARALLAARPAAERQRFERALAFARQAYPTRDGSILWGCELPTGAIRAVALEIGRRLATRRLLDRREDVFHLAPDEIRALLRGRFAEARTTVARRRAERAWVLAHPAPTEIGQMPQAAYRTDALPGSLRRIHEAIEWASTLTPQVSGTPASSRVLGGVPGSPGRHTGAVCVVLGEDDLVRIAPGDVVVCPTTIPAWAPLFGTAGALVTDVGDALSHPAILAREHGIPAVLGTGVATRLLRDGALVTVDGAAGKVTIEAERARPAAESRRMQPPGAVETPVP